MHTLFRVAAVLAMLAAAFHLAGLFVPVNEAPWWRHLLFVLIDIACAIGLWVRPRWFVWPFALLFLQQCSSHGVAFARGIAQGEVRWLDGGVVLFLLITLIGLVLERRPIGRG